MRKSKLKKKEKVCPRLRKFFISNRSALLDWQKEVCSNCVLVDACIFDYSGRPPSVVLRKLKESMIGCPKCQTGPIIAKEINSGLRPSMLVKNEDGDWECDSCGFVIYHQPLFKGRKEAKGRWLA